MTTSRTDGRRTDTRERIRATALDLFVSQGYETTTLAQVADRLEITRPAVYHHFRSKEDVLASSYEEVIPLLDALLAVAADDRPAALDRTIELYAGSFRLVLACMFVNENVLRGSAAAGTLLSRLDELASRLAPDDGVEGRMRGRLALAALNMAAVRGDRVGGTEEERLAAARSLTRLLIGADQGSSTIFPVT